MQSTPAETEVGVPRHSVCFDTTIVRSGVNILLCLALFVGVVSTLGAQSGKLCPTGLSPDGARAVSRPLLLDMLRYWSGAVVAGVWVAGRAAPTEPIV
jgi:hypothetical protein